LPRRPIWAWVRGIGGVSILALLLWRVGMGPFRDGVRVVDGAALAAAFGIGVVTTACCAWRWSLVATGLGVRLPMRKAVSAYYRSQFLNATLPSGVIGDVHRAVRHGLDIGNVRLGVRAVVLERIAGQTVQVTLAVIALFLLPSPVRAHLPISAGVVLATGLGVVVAAKLFARRGSSRWARALRTIGTNIRDGLFAHGNWVGVVLTSAAVLAGQLATFVLAARTAGSTVPLAQLVPLLLLALFAMVLPLNIAGWGPREGVAAWAFGAAGLTVTQGVSTAVTYGVLVFVASLPGAGLLAMRWIGRAPVPALPEGGAHG
jgi:uncharacterized membrane protein YbhN (UPF0104 family)